VTPFRLARLETGIHIVKASTVVDSIAKDSSVLDWKIRRGKPGRPIVSSDVRELVRHERRQSALGRSEDSW
jgi:hypothetical protein